MGIGVFPAEIVSAWAAHPRQQTGVDIPGAAIDGIGDGGGAEDKQADETADSS